MQKPRSIPPQPENKDSTLNEPFVSRSAGNIIGIIDSAAIISENVL